MADTCDGETFAALITNERLPMASQLDLRLVEADQVTTPDLSILSRDKVVDGIVFVGASNPIEYHVLRTRPSDPGRTARVDYDRVPAEAIIHLHRADRPGKSHGVREFTPALALFAMLRDYSLANREASKAAAYFAGTLYTDAPSRGRSRVGGTTARD